MSGMHLSKEFFELLKSIGESKSKQEEDRIVQREIVTLKKKMETGNLTMNVGGESKMGMGGIKAAGASMGGGGVNVLNQNRKKAKEFLVRMLYVGKSKIVWRRKGSLCCCYYCYHICTVYHCIICYIVYNVYALL